MYRNSFQKKHERLIDFYIKHVFGPKKIEYGRNEVIVLCLVKNGEQYIEEFIRHYLKLGAKHIIFLDNGSSDRTIEIASGCDKVTVLKTDFPFAKGNNMRMRDYLINRFAKHRWSLCVDIDEFFDFPFSDKLGLEGLVKYLTGNGYTALTAQMLDMFGVNIVRRRKKKFNLRDYKYYSLEGLIKKDYFFENGNTCNSPIKIHYGGIWNKLFGVSGLCLTKHPLILNDERTKRGRFGHLLLSGKPADFSAVLFHYKFTDNFFAKTQEAVKEGQYFKNSAEYKQYFDKIKDRRAIRLKDRNSKKFESISELLENNFLAPSEKFKEFARHPKEDVAVVIGVKDRFDFRLENAFESLRNQDYDKNLIKIILVDYGSEENLSLKFCELCKKYNVKYINVRDADGWNRSRALNIGIKRAGTKYVLCSDVDIIFEKNYISECVKELQKDPKQILWGTMIDLSEGEINSPINISEYAKFRENAVPRYQLQNSTYTLGPSINMTLVKYYFDLNGYDEFYSAWGCEDDDIIKRFKMWGLKIVNTSDKTSYIHQWHPKYEGLDENEKKQIEKNREHFKTADTLWRNKNGWGLRFYKTTDELKNKLKALKTDFQKLRAQKDDSKDLAAVCCYFNACHYKIRFSNYKIFRKGIVRTGIKLLTVELAFGDDPFELTGFSDVLQLRTGKKNIMWQKERLLNVGIKKLIAEGYKKIVWLDADVVFENDNWVKDLSSKLDKYPLVQVFKEIDRESEKEKIEHSYGSASYYINTKKISYQDARPGLGWAARSSILEKVPLYDLAVINTDNDLLNLYGSFCEDRSLMVIREKCDFFKNFPFLYLFHYMKWAKIWSSYVNGKIHYINQKMKALYHGTFKNRKHGQRDVICKKFHFDPLKDIKIGKSGAWEWASDKPDLHKEVREYFYSRKEDD